MSMLMQQRTGRGHHEIWVRVRAVGMPSTSVHGRGRKMWSGTTYTCCRIPLDHDL